MKSRVLVVDDNPELRELINLRLEMAGFATAEAEDGVAALEVLRQRPDCQIILSDIKMPRMTGPELLQAVRSQGGEQLFILFSGDLPRAQLNQMAKLGVFEILEKGHGEAILESVRSAQAFLERKV